MIKLGSTDGVEIALHALPGAAHADTVPEGDLLIAHATGFHGRAYLPLARRLTGLRILAPDLRGHGEASSPRNEDYRWQGFTEDLAAVVDQLQMPSHGSDAENLSSPIRRPLFGFGHSMGGAVLLRLEQQRPGTFAGLYCYEPIVAPPDRPPPEDPPPIIEGARRRRSTFPSHRAAIENFAAKPPLDVLHPEALDAYVRYGFFAVDDEPDGSVELALPGEEEAEIFLMSTRHDTWELLGAVSCPVVVAYGDPARSHMASFGPRIAERLPRGSSREFGQLGHFGPLEDPDAVAEDVGRAIERWRDEVDSE